MATINLDRPRVFVYGGSNPPVIPVKPYSSGSYDGVAGDIVVDQGNGYVQVDNDPAAGAVIGMSETPWTRPATDGDLVVPVTLCLPGYFYEFSSDEAHDQTDLYIKVETQDNAIGCILDVNGGTGGGAAWVDILGFVSDFFTFRTGGFIAKAGTTQGVGTLNTPYAQWGVAGDTQARVVCMVSYTGCRAVA